MDFNAANAKIQLGKFEFAKLFIEELGWDRHGADLSVPIAGTTFALRAVAEKRGMVAWVCQAPVGQQIPARATRKKIETQVAKRTLEHLIVFTDVVRDEQIWCWSRREPGKPITVTEHVWRAAAGNRPLLQKLERLFVSLDEEAALTLPGVLGKARAAFDAEKVTKKFYDQFKAEHKAFLGFISGITEAADKEWYASLMLNRLMFIYFMQRKGFLDNNTNYLADKLAACKAALGKDNFYSFYRTFLLRLFHEGLGGKVRSPELDRLLGRIPYLNGGLFEKHPIEERCPDIKIPDQAFERIFNYFDRYQWHLDERPLRNDNEINPDVLGYIFEKYINQKQMGAYYTKEDITEYISKNTVIPFLFDAAKSECKVAFENPGGPTVWDHLQDDPDRYIHSSVKHGLTWDVHANATLEQSRLLPLEIAAGIEDVSARTHWNQKASAEFGLPTEIWREVVARRARYSEVHAKLAAGKVREINDLITLNLDILQFAQDAIGRSEGSELVRAFWKAITSVTVLDPTCGSGAFLFAALKILEPLYETCLSRMEIFVRDHERASGNVEDRPKGFRTELEKVEKHPNSRYFILKSIILNNLFGVDIMEEAVEICKLRLFLKLAAQVDPDQKHENLGIEPLPDIDFNIRAGNTLVGYATYAGAEALAGQDMLRKLDFEKIKVKADDLQQTFDQFRKRQIEGDGSAAPEDKAGVRQRLGALEEALNRYLADDYGVRSAKIQDYANWLDSHQPFHWFVEFPRIMQNGGFDVIIGNPPYVEYAKVKEHYGVMWAETLSTNNLFAFVSERCRQLISSRGAIGLILPNSSVSAEKMKPLQRIFRQDSICWISNFAWRPSKLFDGANMLLAIWLVRPHIGRKCFSTRYHRWLADYRDSLFKTLSYVEATSLISEFRIPKLPEASAIGILEKCAKRAGAGNILHSATGGKHSLYYFRAVLYWFKVLVEPPIMEENGIQTPTGEMKELSFPDEVQRDAALAILASSLFSLYYVVWSSCQVVNSPDLMFPAELNGLTKKYGDRLSKLAQRLMEDVVGRSKIQTRNYSSRGRVFVMRKQYFYFKESKRIVDEIDSILAEYYAFSPEELDFIRNYDVKYRMGAEAEADEDE
ncbi:SAM-dependent methyltransferase [Mesorhizobium sp. B2-4-10]|uniref:Eco57I restriction-modification methylase domain-containing protein n=1 Tax=Mesorhizobium sp. B2-4-10 TaxID=2589939 RepID=UPI00112B4464|nr:DNA methyltransferase [Mesorhizobium sp. B2-4-10]TPL16766.1 SAM-dependent methyltransferase [Mesorhizobium sp. B2-4-10]